MNRYTLTIALLSLVAATALAQVGFAQSNPSAMLGTWKLNLAKSTYSPGPGPRSQTVTFEADGKATAETVDAQGNARMTVLMNHNDGKFYPIAGITGSNLAYDAAADKVINDFTMWIIRKKAGKVVETNILEVSADGKTMTVTISGVTPNGQPLNNVLVREKQ
jgi:hypothetical protein